MLVNGDQLVLEYLITDDNHNACRALNMEQEQKEKEKEKDKMSSLLPTAAPANPDTDTGNMRLSLVTC